MHPSRSGGLECRLVEDALVTDGARGHVRAVGGRRGIVRLSGLRLFLFIVFDPSGMGLRVASVFLLVDHFGAF